MVEISAKTTLKKRLKQQHIRCIRGSEVPGFELARRGAELILGRTGEINTATETTGEAGLLELP